MQPAIRWYVSAALIAATPIGCSGGANTGESCTLNNSSLANNPFALEKNNSTCASGLCLAAGHQQYCTKKCTSTADCAAKMVCMPTEPFAAGSYCVRYATPTNVQPSQPVAGSAKYAANEAVTYAQTNWASDAYVVTVLGTGISVDGLLTANGKWIFDVRAASKGSRYIEVEVDTTGAQSTLMEQDADPTFGPDAVDVIGDGLWLYDSQDLKALSEPFGSALFMSSYPDAAASFSLAPGTMMGQPVAVWSYTLLDTASSSTWTASFDAASGDKLF